MFVSYFRSVAGSGRGESSFGIICDLSPRLVDLPSLDHTDHATQAKHARQLPLSRISHQGRHHAPERSSTKSDQENASRAIERIARVRPARFARSPNRATASAKVAQRPISRKLKMSTGVIGFWFIRQAFPHLIQANSCGTISAIPRRSHPGYCPFSRFRRSWHPSRS